jgi:hypothetical protein
MYTLHSWEGNEFEPVTSSATITDILARVPKPWLEFSIHRPGIWLTTFQEAQQTLGALREGRPAAEQADGLFRRLIKMVVTRDDRFVGLAESISAWATLLKSCNGWWARVSLEENLGHVARSRNPG